MFRQSRKKRLQERSVNSAKVDRTLEYNHRLSFYQTPPVLEITVEEFETWAIDRLKVLGEIDSCLLREKTPVEMEKHMKTVLDKYLPLNTNASVNTDQERKKDHYSHYILRLAFCRTPELRERFVKLETALFRMRFNTDLDQDRQAFVDSLDFSWEPASLQEVESLGITAWQSDKTFFKVDFEQVPDLVANRTVALAEGKAYIPASQQITLIIGEFKQRLERALEMTARAIPRLDEDDRLLPILNHLATGMPTATYSSRKPGDTEFKAEDVEGLAQKHFPLCMKHMHNTSIASAHAYFEVRQQYGAFLKGIGLSVDESLRFWRSFVNRNITDDDFRKKGYLYSVRHMYALEGGRIDYQPRNCLQVQKSQGSGDHGCPYRSFPEAKLDSALQNMGISDKQDLAKIHSSVADKRYHVACTMVYELTHKDTATEHTESITHPNEYFDRSFASEKAPEKMATSEPQSQPAEAAS